MTRTQAPADEAAGTRPVMRDPDRGPYVTDEDGHPLDDGVGWDLSWGCRVSFGTDPEGFTVTVSTSAEDQRKGITNRLVTPSQVRQFAHDLLTLADTAEGKSS
jgi:hypothetical protein